MLAAQFLYDYFYSHAREGRDYAIVIALVDSSYFYSHAREGRDRRRWHKSMQETISTHTPARGVTCPNQRVYGASEISTHTPARGVTLLNDEQFRNGGISTHTPARGVTQIEYGSEATPYISTHTPARGVTHRFQVNARNNVPISTHTPARGVTLVASGVPPDLVNFYSHAREGRDEVSAVLARHIDQEFLLTRPRGA